MGMLLRRRGDLENKPLKGYDELTNKPITDPAPKKRKAKAKEK